MADYLTVQGYTTEFVAFAPKWYSVNWTNCEREENSRILGSASKFLRWSMTFTHRDVGVGFYFYQPRKGPENLSSLDRLKCFMKGTPINRLEPDKYRFKDNGLGWYQVFYQPMLPEFEFAIMSVSEAQDVVRRKLEDFMDPNESEYKRINDYFRCLAFNPGDAISKQE